MKCVAFWFLTNGVFDSAQMLEYHYSYCSQFFNKILLNAPIISPILTKLAKDDFFGLAHSTYYVLMC